MLTYLNISILMSSTECTWPCAEHITRHSVLRKLERTLSTSSPWRCLRIRRSAWWLYILSLWGGIATLMLAGTFVEVLLEHGTVSRAGTYEEEKASTVTWLFVTWIEVVSNSNSRETGGQWSLWGGPWRRCSWFGKERRTSPNTFTFAVGQRFNRSNGRRAVVFSGTYDFQNTWSWSVARGIFLVISARI